MKIKTNDKIILNYVSQTVKNKITKKKFKDLIYKLGGENIFYNYELAEHLNSSTIINILANELKEEIKEIVNGIEKGIDVTSYTKKEFQWYQKRLIRMCAENNIDFNTINDSIIELTKEYRNESLVYSLIKILKQVKQLPSDFDTNKLNALVYLVNKGLPIYFINKKIIENMHNSHKKYENIFDKYHITQDITLFFKENDMKFYEYISSSKYSRQLGIAMRNRLKLMYKKGDISLETLNNFRKNLLFLDILQNTNSLFVDCLIANYTDIVFKLKQNINSCFIDDNILNETFQSIERKMNFKQKRIFRYLIILCNLSLGSRDQIESNLIDFCFDFYYKKLDISKYKSFVKHIIKKENLHLLFKQTYKAKQYNGLCNINHIPINLALIKRSIFLDLSKLYSQFYSYSYLITAKDIIQSLIVKNEKINKIRLTQEVINKISSLPYDYLDSLKKISEKIDIYVLLDKKNDDINFNLYIPELLNEFNKLLDSGIINKQQYSLARYLSVWKFIINDIGKRLIMYYTSIVKEKEENIISPNLAVYSTINTYKLSLTD
ncbi:MAG: hypothetical protein N2505_00300 [Endomicrobia bacterium]|nr:hypothetical protein [Endomicrobiia bacterium]